MHPPYTGVRGERGFPDTWGNPTKIIAASPFRIEG